MDTILKNVGTTTIQIPKTFKRYWKELKIPVVYLISSIIQNYPISEQLEVSVVILIRKTTQENKIDFLVKQNEKGNHKQYVKENNMFVYAPH